MRYHLLCPGSLGSADWKIAADSGASSLQIEDGEWHRHGSFSLIEAAGRVTEGRIRSTWRHEVCDLYRAGQLAATISTSLLRDIRACFVGDVPGPDTLELRGDFVEQNYRFFRCARTVAVVSTVWDEPRKGFGVEVRPNEDQAMILAAVLGIRCLCGEPQQVRVFGLPRVRGGVKMAALARRA